MKKEQIKRGIFIFVAAGIIVFGILSFYSSFLYKESCANFECFRDHMIQCKKAVFLNQASEATWRYEITGSGGGACKIDVKLLQAKEGELGIERLNGLEMECLYPKGSFTYPEKNLDNCHGRLKEELQAIIIKKLHSVLVENLVDFEEGLENFS
jgi:hypothetical protein